MRVFKLFFGFILLSAFSFAGYAQQSDIATGLVKLRYRQGISNEYYLSKTTQYGDNAFEVAEGAAAGFYIDKVGESYLILSGAPEISGDYVKGEYTYLYASESLGVDTVDGFNESNGYLQSKDIRNTRRLLSVQAVRKGNILYVLGDESVTDYSKLDQLAQAGTVKKIDLAQISNLEYKFGRESSLPNLPEGCYYIESEIGAEWSVDDYSGLIKARGKTVGYGKSYFYVEGENVGSEPVMSSSNAVAIINGVLYVDSPAEETVSIYSVAGRLLYHAGKPAGEVRIPLSGIDRQVLIVRGSSGWVEKGVRR
jgi:hypothetical protein